MSAPKVKSYTNQYNKQVVNLILNIQQKEFNVDITKEDQPDLMKIENFYQKGKGNFWIALVDNKVVGTISLLDIGNDEVALRKMFVHSSFRGSEINTSHMLLKEAFYWAKDKGVRTIYLGTTPQFLAAHRFYEKNGFKEILKRELPASFPIMQVDKKFYKYVLE